MPAHVVLKKERELLSSLGRHWLVKALLLLVNNRIPPEMQPFMPSNFHDLSDVQKRILLRPYRLLLQNLLNERQN